MSAPEAAQSDFDSSLILSPVGDRQWSSQIDKRYWNAIGPWGGWTVALLLKAVLAEADHAGTPVAMTANLMGGLSEAPLGHPRSRGPGSGRAPSRRSSTARTGTTRRRCTSAASSSSPTPSCARR